MNKNQYWLIIATTTLNVQPKYSLDAKLKALGIKAPEYNLASVVADAVSDDEEKKAIALNKLNDPEAFFYMSNDEAKYKKVAAQMRKLRARDFLSKHGALNAVARVSFYYNQDGAEFNISWVLNRKAAEALDAEEAKQDDDENVVLATDSNDILNTDSNDAIGAKD